MEREELEKKLAALESINDQLMTELTFVDSLMRSIGFTNGLETIKGVAHEILNETIEQQEECEN